MLSVSVKCRCWNIVKLTMNIGKKFLFTLTVLNQNVNLFAFSSEHNYILVSQFPDELLNRGFTVVYMGYFH